jgi:ATP-dependent exoDNAse (exonuclease V) beta subunit
MLQKVNSPQIFILDASAGSGKTYNLAKQYLYLLFSSLTTGSTSQNEKRNSSIQLSFQPTDIRNILAITFTNKAASEMKQRILELLKKIVLNLLNDKEKEDILYPILKYEKDEKQVVLFAERIIENVIRNYHYFQVQTIDSFINQIISVYSLYLGLSPLFKIETQYQDYVNYCVDQLIDNYRKDKNVKKIFDKFVNDYFYLEHKKSWFLKKNIIEVLQLLYEETKKYGKEYKKFEPRVSIEKISKNLVNKIKKFYELLPKDKVYKKFVNAIEQFIKNCSLKKIIPLKNLSNYFTYETIPVLKGYSVNKSLEKMWEDIRKDLKTVIEIHCLQIFNSYLDIFNYVEDRLNLFAKQEDILFLNELNKKINEIVSSDEYFVPTIFMKLAVRIRHCLIDEFQDTSLLQWANIFPIIEEAIANGGSLFYVGDKKQMIYRFSGSEYTLFDDVPKFFKNYVVKKEFLSTNLRSKKEIVEFNNSIFLKENLERFLTIIEEKENNNISVKEEILNIYSNAQQNVKEENDGGFVYGELILDEDYESVIKEKIKEIVNELYEHKEIAILVRKRKEAELVSNWLLEAGFSVESDRTLDVLENDFVKEIVSLISFLLTPSDNLSFVSFIFGEIFLENSKLSYEEIYNFVFENQNEVFLYQKFKQKYPHLWGQFFKPVFETVYFYTAYDFLLKIYEIFNFSYLKIFQINYPFFYKLLELAKKLEQENCSISYFIEKLDSFTEEERQVVAKGEKQINVITIHKAKGLEFEVVILPFVRIDIDVGKHKDYTQRFVVINEEDGLKVVKLSKELIKFSKNLSTIYYEEYKNLLIDELNVLYVAFTRAKEQIYFFVPNSNNNLAKFLFQFNENNKIIQGCKESLTMNSLYVKNNLQNMLKLTAFEYKDKLYSMVEQKLDKFEVVNREKISEGMLLHKIFAFIENLYGKNIEEEISSAIERTKRLVLNKYNINWQKYKDFVLKIITDQKLQNLFFVPQGEVYCEQEIVTAYGETKRIDRIIKLQDKVIVVDYKLKFIEKIEEYKEQVRDYKTIVEQTFSLPAEGFVLFLDTHHLIKV